MLGGPLLALPHQYIVSAQALTYTSWFSYGELFIFEYCKLR
jgi:hypothetical protein